VLREVAVDLERRLNDLPRDDLKAHVLLSELGEFVKLPAWEFFRDTLLRYREDMLKEILDKPELGLELRRAIATIELILRLPTHEISRGRKSKEQLNMLQKSGRIPQALQLGD
jgi:hypothetical protein